MPRASYNTLPDKHYPGKDYFRTNCYYCNIRFNAFGLLGGKAVCTSTVCRSLMKQKNVGRGQDVYGREAQAPRREQFDSDPWDK